MIKILTLLALIGFRWWRLRRYPWRPSLHKQGLEIPQETGPRSVALLAGIMLAVCGGFLLWYLFGTVSSGWPPRVNSSRHESHQPERGFLYVPAMPHYFPTALPPLIAFGRGTLGCARRWFCRGLGPESFGVQPDCVQDPVALPDRTDPALWIQGLKF